MSFAVFAQRLWPDDVCTPPTEAIPPSELALKVDLGPTVGEAELKAFVKNSFSGGVPPLPADYREMFKRPAGITMKRPSGMFKRPAAEEACTTPCKKKKAVDLSSSSTPEKIEIPAALPTHMDEMIRPCVGTGLDPAVVNKRVYSRLWHWAQDAGVDAKTVASAGVARWRELCSYSA